MQEILYEYKMNATTWVYLSSLMTIGIYFKFRRFWSVRNLDLVALIAFAPGLLLVSHDLGQWGFAWIFAVSGFFLVRLLLDPIMVRRPLLEPNLSADGLTFSGVALLLFLMTNVITAEGPLAAASRGERLAEPLKTPTVKSLQTHQGPGYPLFYVLGTIPTKIFSAEREGEQAQYTRNLVLEATARAAAILAQLAVLIGLILIGHRHFDNLVTGIAAAALYLLLPYTAQYTGHVDHVVPAALLVWALHTYRKPVLAGAFLGLAAGVIYYPLFLLPLWISFYWQRGLVRFLIGLLAVLLVVVLVVLAVHLSGNFEPFVTQFRAMTGRNPDGFWQFHEPAYRIPVLAGFVVMCASLALWPAQKNLGTLLACSAAVMLGTQFWHAPNGGVYGLVPAPVAVDRLPAKPGGPDGDHGDWRGVDLLACDSGSGRRKERPGRDGFARRALKATAALVAGRSWCPYRIELSAISNLLSAAGSLSGVCS